MSPGQTTGYQTRTLLSVTSALKASQRPCPSTTAGPVDRVCVGPAPHTPGPFPPGAGTTRSGCATAATLAPRACDQQNRNPTFTEALSQNGAKPEMSRGHVNQSEVASATASWGLLPRLQPTAVTMAMASSGVASPLPSCFCPIFKISGARINLT